RIKRGTNRPRHWIIAMGAMGAIVAFTAGNSHALSVAYANNNNGTLEIVRTTDEGADVFRFDIPPGVLRTVLESYEKVTGIKVESDNKGLFDVASPGVSGMMSSEQALQKILAGTGVSYTFKNPRLIALELHAEGAVVNVDQSDVKIVSSPKYTEPLRNIP